MYEGMCFSLNRDTGGTSKKEENPPVEAVFNGDLEKPPEKQDVMVSRSHRQVKSRVDSALWAVLNQVNDGLLGSQNNILIVYSSLQNTVTKSFTAKLLYYTINCKYKTR